MVVLSCSGWGKYSPGYRHVTRFTSEDTLSPHTIDIYARIPENYKGNTLSLILDITSPDGKLYRDSLYLNVNGVKTKGISDVNGRWRDLYRKYREEVMLEQRGTWIFTLYTSGKNRQLRGTGELGVVIRKM